MRHLPGYFPPSRQEELLAAILEVIAAAPPFQRAEVKGSIETDRGGGKTFTLAITLTGASEETS